jgi:hypothetical protein
LFLDGDGTRRELEIRLLALLSAGFESQSRERKQGELGFSKGM